MYGAQTIQSVEVLDDRSSAFRMDALRGISWLYVLWLLAAGGLSLAVYAIWRGAPVSSVRPSLLVYYTVLVVHLAYRLRGRLQTNIASPDMLFLLLYTLFHLGYVTLYGLGLAPYEDSIFVVEATIPRSLFVINLGLVSFLMGYEILGRQRHLAEGANPTNVPRRGWCVFGVVIMMIAVASHVFVLTIMAPAYRVHGYNALQRINEYTEVFFIVLLWRNAIHVMTLGLVIYIVASALRYGKLFESKWAMTLAILYLLLAVLEGDRGPILQLGAPMMLVRHYFIKPVRVRYLILWALVVLVAFTVLSMVRTTILQPKEMLQEYRYQKDTGVVTWMRPFVEMGSSFLVVNITTHEVPSVQPHWKGTSWRDSTVQIVPFLRGIAFRRGIVGLAPSEWITFTYYGMQASGRAFTVAAEGYLNAGYFGVILELMFFGLFIRWLTIRFSRRPTALWGVIMMACIGLSVMAIRGHMAIMLPAAAQLTVVAVFLSLVIGHDPVPEQEAVMPSYDDTAYATSVTPNGY